MSSSVLVRVGLSGAMILVSVVTTVLVKAQTPETPSKAPEKIAVRVKARLADYKGPSRFMGRKALITFSPDGRLVVSVVIVCFNV